MIMENVREKLVTTAVIYFLFLQLAIRFGIFGPTILDLKHHLNVTQSQMSVVFSVTSAGTCFGAISSGFLFKWIPKQVGLASLLVLLGIMISFVTQILDYYVFLVIHFGIGVTYGAAVNACEAWVLEIWGEDCAPYMQALQFFRGLGYILGPIVVEPFLLPEDRDDLDVTTVATTLLSKVTETVGLNDTDSSDTTDNNIGGKSAIYIPYMLNGLMLVFGAVLTFFQYLYELRKSKARSPMINGSSQSTIISVIDSKEKCEDRNESEIHHKSNDSKFFSLSIIVLCSVFYLFFYEEVVVTYLASFAANIDLHMSKSQGAFMTSMFNLANVIGKAVSIVLAMKLRHFTMLYMNLAVMLVSLVILLIFSNTSTVMLWVGICMLGVGLSSIIASLYALMEDTITMNSMVCGVLNMSGTLGSVFVPLAIADHIESYPLSLIWASLGCAVSCLVLMIIIHVLIHLNNKRKAINQFAVREERNHVMKI